MISRRPHPSRHDALHDWRRSVHQHWIALLSWVMERLPFEEEWDTLPRQELMVLARPGRTIQQRQHYHSQTVTHFRDSGSRHH